MDVEELDLSDLSDGCGAQSLLRTPHKRWGNDKAVDLFDASTCAASTGSRHPEALDAGSDSDGCSSVDLSDLSDIDACKTQAMMPLDLQRSLEHVIDMYEEVAFWISS